jgi:peptidyl-prolyl cis-trans isomerase B (cyclophilin B)
MPATQATIITSLGAIELDLWPDKAPRHVDNFQKLADDGYYNGLVFHRIIPGFMVQTGCPLGNGTGGPGWNVDAEFGDASFVKGTLGMARSQDPNSAGSQFFICVADCNWLDGQYTAFGRVTAGQDVADAISVVPRDHRDQPREEVTMKSVEVR